LGKKTNKKRARKRMRGRYGSERGEGVAGKGGECQGGRAINGEMGGAAKVRGNKGSTGDFA